MHILGENLRFAFTVPLVRLTYDARFSLQTALLYRPPSSIARKGNIVTLEIGA